MTGFSAGKTYALFSTAANERIISELMTRGIDFVLFPTVETEEVETAAAGRILTGVTAFDWLIFPDVYAADFFLAKLEKRGVDFFELDEVSICAFGESVSDRLRYAQVHADIIADSVKTADVYAALQNYLVNENEIENLSFLILKESKAEVGLAHVLIEKGARVTELPVYRLTIDETGEIPKIKALLKGGAVDEFVFSSPFDAANLAHLFPTDPLAELLEGVKISAADGATLQALQEFRLV